MASMSKPSICTGLHEYNVQNVILDREQGWEGIKHAEDMHKWRATNDTETEQLNFTWQSVTDPANSLLH